MRSSSLVLRHWFLENWRNTRYSTRIVCERSRLEIVTYVEVKFGLRIRDSKPSDTGSRGHSDPTDVDAVNSLHPAQDRGHRLHEMLVSSAVEHIFNENAMHAKDNGKQSSGKGKQSKSWSMSDGKGKNKESKEKSKPRKLVIRS